MDEFEITCVAKDECSIISHCNVKGYGIQDVSTIERLISEDACSFFIYDGEKGGIYMQELPQMKQDFLQLIAMD